MLLLLWNRPERDLKKSAQLVAAAQWVAAVQWVKKGVVVGVGGIKKVEKNRNKSTPINKPLEFGLMF